mgnify:CR=1 FL=1
MIAKINIVVCSTKKKRLIAFFIDSAEKTTFGLIAYNINPTKSCMWQEMKANRGIFLSLSVKEWLPDNLPAVWMMAKTRVIKRIHLKPECKWTKIGYIFVDFKSYRPRWMSKTLISAGETPLIRLAWPMVIGFIRVNFSLASADSEVKEW